MAYFLVGRRYKLLERDVFTAIAIVKQQTFLILVIVAEIIQLQRITVNSLCMWPYHFMGWRYMTVRQHTGAWCRRNQPQLFTWGTWFGDCCMIDGLLRGGALYRLEICSLLPNYSLHMGRITIKVDLYMRWRRRLDMHVLQVIDVRQWQAIVSDLFIFEQNFVLNLIILGKSSLHFSWHGLPYYPYTHRLQVTLFCILRR